MTRVSVGSLRRGHVLATEPKHGTRVRRAWDAFLSCPCVPMTMHDVCDEKLTGQLIDKIIFRLNELGLDIRTYKRGGGKGNQSLYWCVGREMPDDRYVDFLANKLNNVVDML